MPVLTETDYDRIGQYEQDQMILDSAYLDPPEYHDPLADWNEDEQPTRQLSPTPLQHKAYTPSHSTGDANLPTLA